MWKARKALQSRWTDAHAAAIYLEGHQDTVYCVQFDERKIITGSRDRTIRIWDMDTMKCVKILGTPKQIGHSTLLPLSRSTRGHKPFVTINPAKSEIPLLPEEHDASLTHQGSILCLQFDDEIIVSGSSDNTLIIWDIKDNYKPIKRLRHHKAGVLDVCFDSEYIVSCSKDTTICLWDRKTGEFLRQLAGHRGPVNAVQMRGKLVVSASGDGVAKLWNLSSGLCVREFPSRDRGLACVEFSPDCRMIYTGGNDQLIYQFDATTGELVREFPGHGNLVRSLHLDHLNSKIISGSYDHSIKVYDVSSGELMCDFAGWTTSWMLSAKADYRRIVATSQDRRVVVVDFGHGLPDVELLMS
jgi:F-box and WD-40 domain protein 1/11